MFEKINSENKNLDFETKKPTIISKIRKFLS